MDEITKKIIKNFTIDMIKDELWKDLAADIGIENFCTMLSHIGGMQMYVPRLDRVLIPARDKLIKKRHNSRRRDFRANFNGRTPLKN